jgi:ribosome-associated protein
MNEPTPESTVQHVVRWALDKKAEALQVLDLSGVLDVTDYFVIATGFSEIQVQAIVDWICDQSREANLEFINVEGRDAGRWALIDYVDVVVHVMLPEERQRYRLDRLWGDAGLTEYSETGEPTVIRESLPAESGAGGGEST